MDVFVEQLVKERQGKREFLAIFGLTLAALLILAATILFMTSLAPLVLVAVAYGWWWCVKMMATEYEYSVTNGDIDIDRIRGRSKRLRLVSVRGDKIESLAPCKERAPLGKFDRVVRCTTRQSDKALWRFTYHSKKNGHTVVVFEPDDRVLHALVEGLPYLLQREVRQKYDIPRATGSSHGSQEGIV